MSEMVERVARVIANTQLRRQYVGDLENISCVIEIDKIWPEFVPEARGAITAMREPTTQMVAAARQSIIDDGHRFKSASLSKEIEDAIYKMDIVRLFRAMIGEAMK
jgi:hypothetical protein